MFSFQQSIKYMLHHSLSLNKHFYKKLSLSSCSFIIKRFKMETSSSVPVIKEDQSEIPGKLAAAAAKIESADLAEIPGIAARVKDSELVDLKSMEKTPNQCECDQEPAKSQSKRALKRQARAQQYKEMKKRRKAENLLQTGREEAGYCLNEFDQTDYYFENGLRKVYPYPFVFAVYAKGRWVGRTLRNILEKEFGFDHPEDVDRAFDEGKIHVNNVRVSVKYVVKNCDYISHQVHRHENPVTAGSLEVVADTDEVVVINKPSSIPCHPCGRYRYNSVVFILGKEMGYSNLRNIYRLDRLTSGVLVMGKTVEATKRLEDQVLNRQVQKEYVCRVEGEFPSETVTVDQPLQALSNKLRLQVVSPTGKSSQTTFTRLSYNGRSSVVKCVPHTGRTHQIRVHLQYLGHPIINDVFYNSDAWGPNKGRHGLLEAPYDVVCSRILQKHQATQWEGGDNPLFYQKLKEAKEKNASKQVDISHNDNINCSTTKTTEHTDDNESAKNLSSDMTDAGITSTTITTSTTVATRSGSGESNDATLLKPSDDKFVTSANESNSATENGSVIVGSSPTALLEEDVPEKSEKKDCLDVNTSESKGCVAPEHSVISGTVDSTRDGLGCTSCISISSTTPTTTMNSGPTRPGFDWSKWNIDPTCDLCRKTTLEPKPRDLVMFLHALKYKGPGWEYETNLPDWAHSDWKQEDQYMLGSTIQSQDTTGCLPAQDV